MSSRTRHVGHWSDAGSPALPPVLFHGELGNYSTSAVILNEPVYSLPPCVEVGCSTALAVKTESVSVRSGGTYTSAQMTHFIEFEIRYLSLEIPLLYSKLTRV